MKEIYISTACLKGKKDYPRVIGTFLRNGIKNIELTGVHPYKKMKSLDYITIDLNSPIADIKADICQLPFNSNSFDFILCNHVLEHINDDLKAMHELFRVMKPGGMGVFQIPLDMNRKITFEDNSIINRKERTEIFGQYDHVRIYGMDYFKRLETCGFRVEKVDYTKTLSDKEISKYCLNKGEIIPVVYKPS